MGKSDPIVDRKSALNHVGWGGLGWPEADAQAGAGRQGGAGEGGEGGLDVNIFKLVNFLQISQAKLTSLPDTLGCLSNITSLVLKGNSLTGIPTSLNNLIKLKLFDLRLNKFIIYRFQGFMH